MNTWLEIGAKKKRDFLAISLSLDTFEALLYLMSKFIVAPERAVSL